mmetsp:Transcript_11031/g.17698  ORF Transcript_11031/g.17698 Transcript_11031/m.17698 type:complete len:242 (+) Transcript_11031:231-956(+)
MRCTVNAVEDVGTAGWITSYMIADAVAEASAGGPSLSSPAAALKRTVSFHSQVCIYEHAICVGDNPSVSRGVPVTIEWTAQDSYQGALLSDKTKIKTKDELKLPSLQRFRLVKAHHSYREIQAAIRSTNVCKRQRQQSREVSPLVQELVDTLNRTFRKTRTMTWHRRKGRKHHHQQLYEDCVKSYCSRNKNDNSSHSSNTDFLNDSSNSTASSAFSTNSKTSNNDLTSLATTGRMILATEP